jgi:CRP-like cAMP-binding protein
MFDPAAAQAQARAFLPTVPLLEGMSEVEIGELAQTMRRQELPVGHVLWRKGDEVKGMLLIVDGRISVSVPLPGDRVVEVTSLGAG